MILLNTEILHLVSLDPILKFELVSCENPGRKLNAVRHVFNPFASCCCFKKNILHWALKETNYRSISDDDRWDVTVVRPLVNPTRHSFLC